MLALATMSDRRYPWPLPRPLCRLTPGRSRPRDGGARVSSQGQHVCRWRTTCHLATGPHDIRVARLAVVAPGVLLASCSPPPSTEMVPEERAVRLQSEAQQAFAAGEVAQAIQLLEEATQARPHDSQLGNDLGLAQEATGDWQAAIGSYEQGIRANPRSWRSHQLNSVRLRFGSPVSSARSSAQRQ